MTLTLIAQNLPMSIAKPPVTANQWFNHLFRAKAAINGGVVRRKIKDMEQFVGFERFQEEIARRGYTAVLNGDQVVVFCNVEPVHLLSHGGKSS